MGIRHTDPVRTRQAIARRRHLWSGCRFERATHISHLIHCALLADMNALACNRRGEIALHSTRTTPPRTVQLEA